METSQHDDALLVSIDLEEVALGDVLADRVVRHALRLEVLQAPRLFDSRIASK